MNDSDLERLTGMDRLQRALVLKNALELYRQGPIGSRPWLIAVIGMAIGAAVFAVGLMVGRALFG